MAVVVSRYNQTVTGALRAGALREYRRRGGAAPRVDVYEAPGSYELPYLAQAAAQSGRYAGVVALGCLVKGETRHDQYIADAVAHGLMRVSLETGVAVAFGVLTVETAEQALDRAGGSRGNKGEEAMGALLDTLAERDRIATGGKSGGVLRRPDEVRPDKTVRAAKGGR